MKAVLIVLLLVVAGVIGLGFYRGWFSFSSGSADSKSNITLTVDQEKFQKDRKSATESVQGLTGRKDKVAEPKNSGDKLP